MDSLEVVDVAAILQGAGLIEVLGRKDTVYLLDENRSRVVHHAVIDTHRLDVEH